MGNEALETADQPHFLRGELLGSQADVVAAGDVMRELFASAGPRAPG